MAERKVRDGFLAIADISGYTSFLTGTELEHAQAILEELTKLILGHVRSPLRLVKLEGDAVFFYVPVEAMSDGERLLERIERCYFDFTAHVQAMRDVTTCACSACRSMQSLDLKFLVHYGSWMIQRLAGTEDLAGPDVILLHRLLKNRVVEQTGIAAYAYLTAAAHERSGRPAGQTHNERYEHIGEVAGTVLDLRARYAEAQRTAGEALTDEMADLRLEYALAAPAALVWDHLLDAGKRRQWQHGVSATANHKNAEGRISTGAQTHCVHSGFTRIATVLDMQPMKSLTLSASYTPPRWTNPPRGVVTFEVVPRSERETAFVIRARLEARGALARLLTRSIGGMMVRREFDASMRTLRAMLAEAQAAQAQPPPPGPAEVAAL